MTDYTRITVFSGNLFGQEFGNYSYIFYYKYDGYYVRVSDGLVVGVRGVYQIVPLQVGNRQTILDLYIFVDEIHDDYVVLMAKLSE